MFLFALLDLDMHTDYLEGNWIVPFDAEDLEHDDLALEIALPAHILTSFNSRRELNVLADPIT